MEVSSRAELATRKWVLVADDDVGLRHALSEMLRHAGFQVVCAGSAEEAVTLLYTSMPIAAVITDVEMPGKIDGMHLVEIIHQIGFPVVVAVASGLDVSKRLRKPIRFFRKPYSRAEIVKFLTEALGGP